MEVPPVEHPRFPFWENQGEEKPFLSILLTKSELTPFGLSGTLFQKMIPG